jgi:hypothetical protein
MRPWERHWVFSLAVLACAAAHAQAPVQMDAAAVPPERFTVLLNDPQARVVDALPTMYVAATNDDLALFHTVAAPGFYAYDGGRRFAGDELMEFIRSRHEAGVVYVWRIQFLHSTRVP